MQVQQNILHTQGQTHINILRLLDTISHRHLYMNTLHILSTEIFCANCIITSHYFAHIPVLLLYSSHH